MLDENEYMSILKIIKKYDYEKEIESFTDWIFTTYQNEKAKH